MKLNKLFESTENPRSILDHTCVSPDIHDTDNIVCLIDVPPLSSPQFEHLLELSGINYTALDEGDHSVYMIKESYKKINLEMLKSYTREMTLQDWIKEVNSIIGGDFDD